MVPSTTRGLPGNTGLGRMLDWLTDWRGRQNPESLLKYSMVVVTDLPDAHYH